MMQTHVASRIGNPRILRMGAFTLVELLVVIGIIALLISILLPSLQRARQSAQSVSCLSNLRQIGLGMAMYTNDNKGRYMPYLLPTVMGAWYHYLVDNEGYWPGNSKNYVSTYQLFNCPSDPKIPFGLDPHSSYPSYTWDEYVRHRGYVSYGQSTGIASDLGDPAATGFKVAKVTDFSSPTESIVVADTEGPVYKNGQFYLHSYYGTNPYMGVLAGRHPGGSCNVLWVDGHASNHAPAERGNPASLYAQGALTDYSMGTNYWDRK